ncbi:MAG: HetP family heterocyst commitment protein, partial [Microcoleus sp. SIO2G3]|nr:HetP family heterocyst commitment protein [Microcoleus sp. SIO2G3]
SWACVLILRSAGYNPLHYLPYRTYARLVKGRNRENQRSISASQGSGHSSQAS